MIIIISCLFDAQRSIGEEGFWIGDLWTEDDDENQCGSELTAGEFEQEEVVGMLDDPFDSAGDVVGHRRGQLEEYGQEEADFLAVVAGCIAPIPTDVQTAQ